jgi:hypothetical protein
MTLTRACSVDREVTMAKSFKFAALALVTALTLTACSSNSGDETDAVDTGSNGATQTVDLAPEVQEKKEQADVAPGEAIVPGSIESTQVAGLSGDCEAAIQPARDLAEKYTSGLLVPAEDQTINQVLTDARTSCSEEEFANWYFDEFVGWQNATP